MKDFTLNFSTNSVLKDIKQKTVNVLEYLFIGALLVSFATFMLDNQTINSLTIFFLCFLFKTILFSSSILILILIT